MKDLIWLIPLFPLAGFLANGLLYLAGSRPTRRDLQHDSHGEQPAAESAKDAGHPHAHMHGETHPRFQSIHTLVGTGSVAISLLFPFGSIFDVGLRALAGGAASALTLSRWI